MAKKQQQNKIGESFEQHLPEELVPDFIWNNISNALDTKLTSDESSEKIKTSFEEGFNDDVVPAFLWEGIQSSLDQTSVTQIADNNDNKIKRSFEGGHEDPLPENLWENVENQLEIEGVWKRVLKGLNKRTRRRYWQEKGMQFGIVALAVLLLRGCDFGTWTPTSPLANQSNHSSTVEFAQQKLSSTTANTNNVKFNTITTDPSNKTIPTTNNNSTLNKTKYTATNTGTEIAKSSSFVNNGIPSESVLKENKLSISDKEIPTNIVKNIVLTQNGTVAKKENTKTTNKGIKATTVLQNLVILNPSNNTSSKSELSKSLHLFDVPTIPTTPFAATSIATEKKKSTNSYSNNSSITTFKQAKELFPLTPIATLTGQALGDSSIQELHNFEINTVANRKRHHIRLELGMNGKVGTSLLLGNATHKALETTSMVKTEMRTVGGVGIMLGCHLTANDAIVLGAYPFSNSQQYFGGYTNEGRYYHKEVKLTYFDFTLGYQRTLFHYNDFGTVPSSMYVRLDYGLGYLNKSEEIINGLAVELGDSYNKINHNIGLTVGNTHRINRFVIDYGIYGNIGLSSVLSSTGSHTMEYSNLANMGGYIGLRYVL